MVFVINTKKFLKSLRGFLVLLSSAIYPISCLGCGKEGVGLCAECLAVLPPPDFEQDEQIISAFSYQNKVVKKAIRSLKYKNGQYLAPILAKALYERVLPELADRKLLQNWSEALLIPIPLSTRRLRKRGYNQAELLAESLCKEDCGENFTIEKNTLIRSIDTPPQADIKNKGERKNNVRGCFTVKKPELVRGKNVILIDDVATTGATLHEAERALKKVGVRKFLKITVAH